VTFSSPLLLLTLLAIPLAIGLWKLAERRRMRYAVRFTNLDVLASVAGGRPWRRYVAPLLFLLALGSLCVALARPNLTRMIPSDRATVILVIDASGSMQARDVRPTRLEAAQDAVRTFVEKAPKRLRIGLVVFAGEPQVAAPPTTDRSLVLEAVDEIGFFPGFGGTAIGDALGAAVQLGLQSIGNSRGNRNLASAVAAPSPLPKSERGLVSILLLSDGKQTRGVLQPSQGADRAKAVGFPVYTVSLGTAGGTLTRGFGAFSRRLPVPPDPATLRAIALRTGGNFFRARDSDALQAAYSKLGSSLGRTPGKTEITFAFLLGGIGLLLAAGVASAAFAPRFP
jgi:Ca-activated chloride channel family protein